MPTMKKEKVKSDGQVIAIVQTPVFSSLAEAVSTLTEAKVLSLAMTQNATNLKNNARAEFAGKPTKAKLQQEGMAQLATELNAAIQSGDEATKAKLMLTLSDETKRNEYFEQFETTATAQWSERRKQRIAEVAAQLKTETDVVDEEDDSSASK